MVTRQERPAIATRGRVVGEEGITTFTARDYRSDVKPVWCPGCGDFGVLSATSKALAQLQILPHQLVIVSGIGCSSRMPYFMSAYGIHGVHGRSIPIATGLKLARPDLTVMAMGGDGDLFSIGAGHMPPAAARNVDITCVMMDNQTYGLTKNQPSPTSFVGYKTKASPYGTVARPQHPVLLALAYGASFVARAYSAKANHMASIIAQAIEHKGFSFIQVHSPCAEFYNTYDYYDKEIADMPEGYDPTDMRHALELALTETTVHLGVFFREERPTIGEEVRAFEAQTQPFDLKKYLEHFA